MKSIIAIALLCWSSPLIKAVSESDSDAIAFHKIFRDTGDGTFKIDPTDVCGKDVQFCCSPCTTTGGTGGTGGKPGEDTSKCPVACPAGWNTFGPLTDHCYLMPPQPVKTYNFWDGVAYCKASEPTSYPVVINDLSEQLVGSAVVLQYAANYILQISNIFAWFGAYAKDDGSWVWLDGSEQKDNILMALVGLKDVLAKSKNGTCLGADAKTLGVWQSRPCSDLTGGVICEMKKRNVCGATGGMLPISPLKLDMEGIKNLFPKGIGIPFSDVFTLGGNLFSNNGTGGILSTIGSGASSIVDKGSSILSNLNPFGKK